jgi:hypothetical protein
MGTQKVEGTPYRTPATPNCSCARCQVAPWRLSFAWVLGRLVVASLCAGGLILASGEAIVHVFNASQVTRLCHDEACRDRVNIVGTHSTPYECQHPEHRMSIVELHDNEVEVRCMCGGHDAGAPPAFLPY